MRIVRSSTTNASTKKAIVPSWAMHSALFSHATTATADNNGDGSTEHVLFDITAGDEAYWGGTLYQNDETNAPCRALQLTVVYLRQADACNSCPEAAIEEVPVVYNIPAGSTEFEIPLGWIVEMRALVVDGNGAATSVVLDKDQALMYCYDLAQCCDKMVAI